jgi:cellulose synthase operon protein C
VLITLAACASVPGAGRGYAGGHDTHEDWRRLVAGESTTAERGFADKPRGVTPFDPFAQFGQAFVAYEQGNTDAALNGLMRLLQEASVPTSDPWTRWLATAGSSWMGTLVYETESWRSRVDELVSLLGPGLPWLARFELMQVADDTARRAGRLDSVLRIAHEAHCPNSAVNFGSAGHHAVLDLVSKQTASGHASQVLVSGCRVQVPSQTNLPGVLVVQSQLDVPKPGHYDVAIEFRGLAAMRIDDGAWVYHGTPSSWGPHRSAYPVKLKGGKHKIELRLSTYSGGADYWLAAFESNDTGMTTAPQAPVSMPSDLVGPLSALSNILVSRLSGQWNEGFLQVQHLLTYKSFALGLVEAGRFWESEPSRPDNLTRDNARTAWRQAVELDPLLVRARLALSALENLDGRPREASASAMAAMLAAPKWWPAALAAHDALNTEGLEAQADRALGQAMQVIHSSDTALPSTAWACPVLEAALRRARLREQVSKVDPLLHQISGCEARDLGWPARLLETGRSAQAALAYQAIATISSAPQWLLPEQAAALAASGDAQSAVSLLRTQSVVWPKESSFLLRMANFQTQAAMHSDARLTVENALRKFPAAADVRQVARAMNVPMLGDADRADGLAVVSKFIKSGRRYDAPAVFVLDRLVERVFADGSRTLLTHSIVKVQSKEALDRWGEVNVPAGSEVLALRTIKPDLSVREPEDIFGKESVSAPELEVGDFVEWETLESIEPSPAFGGGFVGQRFYFQSNEAPMERSEYLIISPRDLRLDFDARGGAPSAVQEDAGSGMIGHRFVAEHVPQVFPERAAVAALHWIPSLRISSGVDVQRWSRFVSDRLSTVARANPAVQVVAQSILKDAGGESASVRSRAEAIVSWVTSNIESEGSADETASFAVARGRGNRLAVALALSKSLKVDAELVLARPLSIAERDERSSPQEAMSYSDVLLRFPGINAQVLDKRTAGRSPDVFVDLRLRYAPFGYLPPILDGASAIRLIDSSPIQVRTAVTDERKVHLSVVVTPKGDATIVAKEHLVGSAAVDWAEALHQLGSDDDKRRHRFEEAYLSYHFPGSTLKSLSFACSKDHMDIEYQLTVERFATQTDRGLSLEPRFFLSQPGRRYATEVSRKTTLLIGPDLPLDLEAQIKWPKDAVVADLGKNVLVHPMGAFGPSFLEERKPVATNSATVLLRRSSLGPIVRIEPSNYATVSGELRRVDAAEQSAIHVTLKGVTK